MSTKKVKPLVMRTQDELFAWDAYFGSVARTYAVGNGSAAHVADLMLLQRRERLQRSRCDSTVGGTSRGRRCSLKLGHSGHCT